MIFLCLKQALNKMNGRIDIHEIKCGPFDLPSSCLWICDDKRVLMFTRKGSIASTQPNINTKYELLRLLDQCAYAVQLPSNCRAVNLLTVANISAEKSEECTTVLTAFS